MHEKAKSLWIEALESGEYLQVGGTLKREGRHCCLGVLCEVVAKNKLPGFRFVTILENHISVTEHGGQTVGGVLTSALRESLRMQQKLEDQLIQLNDGGIPFSEIAEVIKREA